jgi:hypothetical protein
MRAICIGKYWAIKLDNNRLLDDDNNQLMTFPDHVRAREYIEKVTQKIDYHDILNKIQFFQGSRSGRLLWTDKSEEIQNIDLDHFNRDINDIRDYIISLENMLLINVDIEKARGALVGDGYLKEEVDKFTDERVKQIWSDRFKLEIITGYNQSKRMGLI